MFFSSSFSIIEIWVRTWSSSCTEIRFWGVWDLGSTVQIVAFSLGGGIGRDERFSIEVQDSYP